jgi:hypothetical protein
MMKITYLIKNSSHHFEVLPNMLLNATMNQGSFRSWPLLVLALPVLAKLRSSKLQVISLGVDPLCIVYTNLCKMRSPIKYAREKNVSMMTFNNEEELWKVTDFFPDAHLVIRILPPASKVVCNLGCKYGVPPKEAFTLLKKAKKS